MKVNRILTVVLCALVVAACGRKEQPKERVAKVTTVVVGQTGVTGVHDYTGTVGGRATTVLSFEIPGKVSRLLVDEGDGVKRGQVLAAVEPTTLRDAHYAAQVTLKQAQDAWKRMKPLHDQGVISDLKWVDVETKLEQARATESMARAQLGHATLTAPASGVISERLAELGTTVVPGQPVLRLVDVSRVEVKVAVPENAISSVHKGAPAAITVGALNGAHYTARVDEIGVEANPLSHTYDVKLTLANPGGRLMPGMVCNVQLQTGGGSAASVDRIVIPAAAVCLDADNRRFVWIVQNGRAVKRSIVTGDFAGDGVEVVSGLDAGDRLITDGAIKVSNGMKVTENK